MHYYSSPVCRSESPDALPCGSSGPRPCEHRSRTGRRIFWNSKSVSRHCPVSVAWAAPAPAVGTTGGVHCWPRPGPDWPPPGRPTGHVGLEC